MGLLDSLSNAWCLECTRSGPEMLPVLLLLRMVSVLPPKRWRLGLNEQAFVFSQF